MTEKGVSEPNSMGHTFQFKLHQCWSIEYSPKPWKWVMSVVVVMDGWHRTRLKSARWLHFLPMKIQKKMWNQGGELPLVDFEWIYHESMWNNTNKRFFGFLSVLAMRNGIESIDSMRFHPVCTRKTCLECERWDKTDRFHACGKDLPGVGDGVDVWVKAFPGSCHFSKSANRGGKVNGSENVFEQMLILC